MSDSDSEIRDPESEGPSLDAADENERRILELELIKVRKEAAAARLEARAAELELMIRQLAEQDANEVENLVQSARSEFGTTSKATDTANTKPNPSSFPSAESPNPILRVDSARNTIVSAQSNRASAPVVFVRPIQRATTTQQSSSGEHLSPDGTNATSAGPSLNPQPTPTIQSWDDFADGDTKNAGDFTPKSVTPKSVTPKSVTPESETIESADDRVFLGSTPDSKKESEASRTNQIEELHRQDGAHLSVQQPHFDRPSNNASNPAFGLFGQERESTTAVVIRTDAKESAETERFTANDVSTDALAIDEDETEVQRDSRKRPAALLVSTVAHIAILLFLALLTLSTHRPKDQVALSASVSEPSEDPMQTFEFEAVEPSEQSEPTETAQEVEVSDIGEIAVAEINPNAVPGPPAPNMADMLSTSQLSAANMSLKSNSDAKIQFCGVEGGGNHFVYLVDSSGSMGSAFESARAELLNSIDALKPNQKFYVVFFDAESDYMRLSNPNADESGSVKATNENKQALKRWAMKINMDRGRAPYDPLRFALKLKPDVIFLLSDGEFPQGIEDLLKEENHYDNLFGDDGLISIVHTIGYHSREGESRMRRIAQQNKGQYRHIPKP